MDPDFELISFRLTEDVLTSSIERSQSSSNTVDMDDPVDPLDSPIL